MRLALVHDYLYVYGGAERTLLEVHREWPRAPIYTLLYVRDRLPDAFRGMDVRPTWVDRLPWRLRLQRLYAMLQPLAFGGLRVAGADTVLSFASFGAKAVPAPPGDGTSATATPRRGSSGARRAGSTAAACRARCAGPRTPSIARCGAGTSQPPGGWIVS